jgi:hypothetical protein
MSMNDGPQWEPAEPSESQPPSAPEPMRLGQVFEIGTRILRRHWAVALTVALLFTGPAALLSAATTLQFTDVAVDLLPGLGEGVIEADPDLSDAEVGRLLDAFVPFLLGTLVAGVLGSIGALGISAVVAEDYHARPATVRTALRACLRRAPSALVFMLVTGLLVTGLIVLGILGMGAAMLVLPAASSGGPGVFVALIIGVALVLALIYLTMRWAVVYPVMVEEGAGWRGAISRSWHLSGDNILRIFAVLVLVTIVTALISAILGSLLDALLVNVVAATFGLDPQVASILALALASVVVAPAMAVYTAVLYFDLRTRRDVPSAPSTAAPDGDFVS